MSRIIKKAALAICATLVCLAAAEVSLRLFAPVSTGVYALDDRYLHRLVPNSGKVYKHDEANGGGEVEVRINSRGFREREFGPTAPPGTRRVIVYGDSFVEAEFTPLEESFTRQLERRLGEAGAVEVLNAGVIAYGPDQVSLRVETEVDELRPDLIVVALFAGNDFGDLLRNKIYRLTPEGSLVKNDYRLSPVLRRQYRQPRSVLLYKLRQAFARLGGEEVEADAPAEFSREAYVARSIRRCRQQYVSYVRDGDDVVRDLRGDQYDADISLGTDAEAADYKKRLMEEVLKQIKGTAAARGVPVVLVFIPAVIDLTDEFAIDRASYPSYDPAALTRALAEIADRNRIPHVNLFDLFRASDPAALYFKFPDSHWNERGQRLAAQATGDLIVSEGLLK